MGVCVRSVSKLCPTLCTSMDYSPPARLLCPWDFPGKNTGVGFHSLLQRIFPTQGLSLCLLHWQVDSLPAETLGKPHYALSFYSNVHTVYGPEVGPLF